MVPQTLVPGVQNEGEADLAAQLAAAETQQRGRRGIEQQTQQRPLVTLAVEDQWVQLMGQGEHVMEIGHRQELLLASGGPGGRIRALALGAVAVAATVVGVLLETASRAPLVLPTQRGRAAMRDRPGGLALTGAVDDCAGRLRRMGKTSANSQRVRSASAAGSGAAGDMILLLEILVLGMPQQFQRALDTSQLLAGHV